MFSCNFFHVKFFRYIKDATELEEFQQDAFVGLDKLEILYVIIGNYTSSYRT